MQKQLLVAYSLALLLQGCGGGSSPTTAPTVTVDTSAFPIDLVIASPTDSSDTSPLRSTRSVSPTGYHTFVLNRINSLLNGTTALSSVFDVEDLYRLPNNASCYGPQLLYNQHPDGTPTSGTLPPGDLGIWQETETSTTETCAAAQLNAQLKGIRDRNQSSLMVLASLLYNAAASGAALPTAGHSIDLTSQMNTATSGTGVTFSSATLARLSDGDWQYNIQFTVTRTSGNVNGTVSLRHEAGSSAYKGIMQYALEDTMTGGNCGSGTNNITRIGTVAYDKTSSTHLVFDAREGGFCGHTLAANTGITASLADPTSNWSDDFSLFKAAYNPSDLAGSYAYTWQAGHNDSHSRVLNVGLNAARSVTSSDGTTTITADGEAWFGYGNNITQSSTTLGQINGFICNWAGPGNVHTLQEKAQRQFLNRSSSTGKYETVTAGSNIIYAPANSCLNSTNTFVYDRDLSGTIDGDDLSKVVNNPTVSDELAAGLFPLSTTVYATDTTTYPDIETMISARGFTLPTSPSLP